MTAPKYSLSGRQKHALARGEKLHLAILDPDPETGDPLFIAVAALPEIPANHIKSAERIDLPCSIARGGSGLTGVLGKLEPAEGVPCAWIRCIEVVVCEREDSRQPSRETRAIQWPGGVE